ncbi:MAG TPA: M28 family peptidase [Vicinamibacterales bacterium]|nr:M28 family peptidase [Vicinamibacterales bacterium]
MRVRKVCACAAACVLVVIAMPAQEREDRTLLSHDQMRSIVNEASGERAMHTLLELVPYQRVRPASEYGGPFRESEVMARRAKEYGFTNVRIETFPSGPQWQPSVGELWMTTPVSRKLYDIHDVALALGQGTPTGDVSGELIDVGAGRASDLEGKDLTGKVLLSSSGLGAFTQAVSKGAVGIIGYTALRPNDFPDQIPDTRFNPPQGATSPTFGWAVEPRVGRDLALRLGRGEKITIRSLVKAEMVPSKAEVVHAEIAGDGSTTQEVAVSGHLYEGVIKQGANDDNSGCALTLEIGRAYIKLVSEGRLPKPKRTINFQWGAEISGTNAWLNAHPDKETAIIGDLNFDMEGIRLAMSRSYWILQRTPDTFPSYINDVAQSMMEWVSDVSRERVRYRANGYAPSLDITASTGSEDAFYIRIDKHYGSSDHVTYMQHGIPSVMFITWPDMWYHSSQDTIDKQDPTQYKRAAVVGIGAMAALAAGTDAMAGRITAENLGRGSGRIGDSMRKAAGYLADATDAAGLMAAYKDARVTVRHQAAVEKGVIRSSAVLYEDPSGAASRLAGLEASIDKTLAMRYDELRALYAVHAARVQAPALGATSDWPMTPAEREASNLVVECVNGATRSGCASAGGRGGGRGGGGGGAGRGSGQAGPSLPQHMNAELSILLGKGKTVLEIRDFLSGEFEPVPLEDVMAVLKTREASGTIRLVAKPAQPARKK